MIDYTSPERNDLAEFNLGHYQWQWGQADSRESAAKVHDLTHLYNAAGRRHQTESARYTDWAGAKHYTRYIHEDIMGSSYYYTNPETGYVTNQHEYTTWGNNTKAPTYNYDPEYRASEPYFTGHPYDGSLNLYYVENRFYDPETGNFLSSDPVRSGLNWYAYCNGNPTTYVDVLGLEPTFAKYADEFFFNKMEHSENVGRVSNNLLQEIEILANGSHAVIILLIVNGILNENEKNLYPHVNWGAIGGGNYDKGVQKDGSGRYKVAVGPRVLIPNYPDDGRIWG